MSHVAPRDAYWTFGSLEAEPWETSEPIRVRTGIHSGEAELREGDYYGTVVNRCARIRSSAEPGQILLSAATAGLLDGTTPAGTELHALGLRTLKDIAEPEEPGAALACQTPSIAFAHGGWGVADGDADVPLH